MCLCRNVHAGCKNFDLGTRQVCANCQLWALKRVHVPLEVRSIESMALGKRKEERQELSIATMEFPKSPGRWFYSRLNKVLREVGFDQMVEELCESYYSNSSGHGRPSIPPGVYFRMLLVGYFEKIDLQREIAWRWSDSLSLREFLGLAPDEASLDHSSLTRIRACLPVEIHKQVFTDATTLEALRRLGEDLEALRTLGIEEPGDKSPSDDEPIALRSRQERQEDIERGVGIFETVTLNCFTTQKKPPTTTFSLHFSSLGSARGHPHPPSSSSPSFSGLKVPGAFRPEFFGSRVRVTKVVWVERIGWSWLKIKRNGLRLYYSMRRLSGSEINTRSHLVHPLLFFSKGWEEDVPPVLFPPSFFRP